MLTRRQTLLSLAALPLVSLAQHQTAEAWPAKFINFIVGGAPGGGLDAFGRVIADMVSKTLEQTVVVHNRPGANGAIAADFVAKGLPDGYSFLFTNASSIVVNEALGVPVPYKPDELQPVAQLSSGGVLLIASKRSGVRDLADFVNYVKSNPGVHYASWGVGSTGHISMEWICQQAGLSMEHIAYKSIAQIPIDMVAMDNLNFAFVDARHTAIPYVQAGTIAPVAVSGSGRSPAFPDTPTMSEQGYPMEADGWYGLLCSSAVDPAIVTKMNAAIRRGLKTEAMKKKLKEVFIAQPPDFSPGEFKQSIERDLDVWRRAVERANIKVV